MNYPPGANHQWQPVHPPAPVRPNKHPFVKGFAVAAVLAIIAPIVLFATAGAPSSSEAVGRAVGMLAAPGIIAALIIGFIARASHRFWPWWQYAVLVAPAAILVFLLSAAGQLGSQA